MAIVTMTHLALSADKSAVRAPGLEGVEDPAVKLDQNVASALDQMVAYVPSEVIGIYVAGVGIIGATSGVVKWALFCLALALVPLFVWLADRIARQSNPGLSRAPGKLVLVGSFAVCAFAAWACALPDTPFASLWGADATRYGSFAAVVLAALMPKIAVALGLAPRP
jgi:hypothetical protein